MSIDVRLENGDLPQQGAVFAGPELVVQNVLVRLRTFIGEDPEDIRRGLPWTEWNQRKATDNLLAEMEDLIGAEILGTPGVDEILTLAVRREANDRVVGTASISITDETTQNAVEFALTFTPSDPVGVAYRLLR